MQLFKYFWAKLTIYIFSKLIEIMFNLKEENEEFFILSNY